MTSLHMYGNQIGEKCIASCELLQVSNQVITDKTYRVHQNHTDPHDQTSQTRSQCQVSQPFPGYWLRLHHSNIWMLFLSLSYKQSLMINSTSKCCLPEENESFPCLGLIQTNLFCKHYWSTTEWLWEEINLNGNAWLINFTTVNNHPCITVCNCIPHHIWTAHKRIMD